MNDDPTIIDKIATLSWQATHDAVTSLPNRRQLQVKLAQAVAQARRLDQPLAILVIDVDSFRSVNAALGQSGGDALLAMAAARIQACAGEHLVARTGDNEFTVVLDDEPSEAVLRVASTILQMFQQPFDVAGHDITVTASIGIGDLARDGEGSDFLMRAASAAVRRAKELGGNQRQHSSTALTLAEHDRLHIEQRIREAITKGQLSLHYQPQHRLGDGEVVGVEALLRWTRDGQTVPACAFIRAIEHSSVVIEIGEWVVREACSQLAEWRRNGLHIPRVAVNIGARHFQQPRLAETISRVLREHALSGSDLEIEITETTAMYDAENTVRTFEALRALGVCITIDDFGTGYSSLAYLHRFAITGLKIDRSFVANVPGSRSSTAIVNAIIATAHALDLHVVGEGIETADQAKFLAISDCDLGQGYLFAHPLAAADVPVYIRNKRSS